MDESFELFLAKRLLIKHGCYSKEGQECLASFFSRLKKGHFSVRLQELAFPSSIDALPASLISKGETAAPLVRVGEEIYIQKSWEYEKRIWEGIERIRKGPFFPLFEEANFFKELEKDKKGGKLLKAQVEAIERAYKEPFFALTGGPGTGKTYTASKMISLFSRSLKPGEEFFVTLASPTGKAATHLQSAIEKLGPFSSVKMEGTTLHRLLNLRPGETKRFSPRRIDADLILVDEASMLDAPILLELLNSICVGTRLILMGDPDQLPPVESISFFPKIAAKIGHRLDECVRTENRALRDLAEAVRLSRKEEMLKILERQEPALHQAPFEFDPSLKKGLFAFLDPIVSEERPDPIACLKHYNTRRVLNALRQGPFGSDAINSEILELLNETKERWQAIPILVTANDVRSGLYNGMSGVLIKEAKKPLREAKAYFLDKGEAIFSLPPFELAFCISIHKSQGSEFDKVLALFPKGSENFGKEALYTALTRAKKEFSWVGDKETLCRMVISH